MTQTNNQAGQLAACPFCRSENAHLFNSLDEHGRNSFGIQCGASDCGICGPERGSEAEAIAAWNRCAISQQAAEPVQQEPPVPQYQAIFDAIGAATKIVDLMWLSISVESFKTALQVHGYVVAPVHAVPQQAQDVQHRLDDLLAAAASLPQPSEQTARFDGGHAKLPWRVTEANEKKTREIVGADGVTVAKLTALDMANAQFIVECVNAAPPAKQAALAHHCPHCGYDHSVGPLCKTAAEQPPQLSDEQKDAARYWWLKMESSPGAAFELLKTSWTRWDEVIDAAMSDKDVPYCTRSGDKTKLLCGECKPYGHCCGI